MPSAVSNPPLADFVLASSSPRRLMLVRQLGVEPAEILSPDIDETPKRQERPRHYVDRMAIEKARAGAVVRPSKVILAADTTVACGQRILPKAEDETTARACLSLLSGRRHQVYSALCVIDKDGREHPRVVRSIVKFKRLHAREIDAYIASGEWHGKAGGYAIQGLGAAFITFISGSYTAIVGLPLYETRTALNAAGVRVL